MLQEKKGNFDEAFLEIEFILNGAHSFQTQITFGVYLCLLTYLSCYWNLLNFVSAKCYANINNYELNRPYRQ